MTLTPHQKKVRNFHDQESKEYQRLRYHSQTCEGLSYVTRKDLVLAMVNMNSGKVLDIGCGPGILTKDLLSKSLEVLNIDISIGMINQAKKELSSNPLSRNAYFAVSNASQICFGNNKIDLVLCIGVLCYVKDLNSVLSEIHRILKTGGTAILQINRIWCPTIYKKFIPLYRYLKSKLTAKKYDQINFEFNLFSHRSFMRTIESKGFFIEELQCYDYRVPFLDILMPKFSLKLGKKMFENRRVKLVRWFSHGLLMKVTKIDVGK